MEFASFRNWLSVLDANQFEALKDRKGWAVVLLFGLLGTLLGSFVPPTREFFEMRFEPMVFAWVILLVMAGLSSTDEVLRRLEPEWFGILLILTSATLQGFFWLWVCFSSVTGGTVLVAFPILISAYHGEFFQASREYPWGFLASILAIFVAAVFAPTPEHSVIVGMGGLLALGATFVMGNNARIRRLGMLERDALREAVDAQLLADQMLQIENIHETIMELRGTNHDAANALSGVLFNLSLLIGEAQSSGSKELESLSSLATDLRRALERLKQLVDRGKKIGVSDRTQPVEAVAVVNSIVRDLDSEFSSVDVHLSGDDASVYLSLPDGQATLQRIMDNVIRNACEGDGHHRPTCVDVAYSPVSEGLLEIRIADNGPGFSSEQLNSPVSTIQTTKTQGTGLGLYTTQRLIFASGGEMVLANNDDGGALVHIRLPVTGI